MSRLVRWLVAVALPFAAGCGKENPPAPAPSPPAPVVAAGPPAPALPPDPTTLAYTDRTRALLDAAANGRVSLVAELIAKGAAVNDKGEGGKTVLHKAAAGGHKTAVAALLALGADPQEKDADGVTPLLAAAEAGHPEVLAVLLYPPATSALSADLLKLAGLTVKPADPGKAAELDIRLLDQADKTGQRVLHKAAAGGNPDCIRYLDGRNNGNNYYPVRDQHGQSDDRGRTPLMLAAAAGHVRAVEALVSSSQDHLRRTDRAGKTALDLAEVGGHRPVVRLLWRERIKVAVPAGDLPTLEAGLTALGGDFPAAALSQAVSDGPVEAVRLVMDRWKDKPPANKRVLMEGDGSPAVLAAIRRGDERLVRLVLDKDWWKDPTTLRLYLVTKRHDNTPLPDLGRRYAQSGPEYESLRKAAAVIDEVLAAVAEKK